MENSTAVAKFAEGQRVLYTEQNFRGVIRDVCTGILDGMYNVRLDSGLTCVSGSSLRVDPEQAPEAIGVRVSEYSLKAPKTGKHIRFATRVTFPNGREVDFMEPMTRKFAIAQAKDVLYKEYREYFTASCPDQEPMAREHWEATLLGVR
jgi:hypothetical protein